MRLPTVPFWIPWLFKHRLWQGPQRDNHGQPAVYLTFDDGPIPEVTPWVLDELAAAKAKATFFCIGDNACKHPELVAAILKQGHALGNHTQNHCKGTETDTQTYVDNALAFHTKTGIQTKLFRPPYGKLSGSQARALKKRGYTLVMWSLLSYDWDKSFSPEKIQSILRKNVQPGSIVVFHDSLKAENNLRQVLPNFLRALNDMGLVMLPLKESKLSGNWA